MLKSAVFETECSSRGCTFSGCQSRKSNSCDGKMLSTLRQIEISVKQLTGKDRRKGTCKNGWKRFRGHCYREFVQKLDWFGAQMFCRLQKATLVRIDNKEENEWLVKTFSKEQLWLDLNDLSVEGRWRFFTTGKPVIYTNWMPRQPDSVGEDCAHMNYPGYKKGQWNDRECGVKLRFICESSGTLMN
ncbi:low affinity immunoglobulin epsilon Fc receptor-like [Saccostrea cucullata]|uniref:low affinity immunoglobulin epsilon Fc receptor-like n=1 Tax=Saccostrea cuccullata TaxID=36930 RepID=UPI002ED48EB5